LQNVSVGVGPTTRHGDGSSTSLKPPRRDLLRLHDTTGGTWEEMFADLDAIVAPLVTDGWEVLDRLQEESSAYGDSVICSLKRGR